MAREGHPEAPEREPRIGPFKRRDVIKRGALLLLMGVSIYLLAPGLVEVFSSWRQVRELEPAWLGLMVVLEAASFACLWILQKLAVGCRRWLPIIASQLAGNAFGRIVPGGGAAAAAYQFRMLREAGLPSGPIATGLTAVHFLTFATLLALPLLAVPALLRGASIADDLLQALWIGVLALVILFAIGALLLATDGPLRFVGRLIERVRNWIVRRREPLTGLPDRLIDERDLIRSVIGANWWQALLASIGRWAFDFGVLLAALAAVGDDASPSLVLIAYVVAQLAGMIPVTPGGLGFVEAGMTATLALAGVSAADALVATLAYRLISFWLPLPFGGLGVWLHRRYVRGAPPEPSPGGAAA